MEVEQRYGFAEDENEFARDRVSKGVREEDRIMF